jgi:hypothetical protein
MSQPTMDDLTSPGDQWATSSTGMDDDAQRTMQL